MFSKPVALMCLCQKMYNMCIMYSFLNLIFMLLVSQRMAWAQKERCVELEIYTVKEDELSIPSNAYITLSFGLNVSTCKELDTVFKVAVKTKTSNNLTEEDGRVELTRDKCTVTIEEHVTCTGRVGVAELFRQVNTSHAAIEWTMVWTEGGGLRYLRKLLSLYVFDFLTDTVSTVGSPSLSNIHPLNDSHELVILNCAFQASP